MNEHLSFMAAMAILMVGGGPFSLAARPGRPRALAEIAFHFYSNLSLFEFTLAEIAFASGYDIKYCKTFMQYYSQ